IPICDVANAAITYVQRSYRDPHSLWYLSVSSPVQFWVAASVEDRIFAASLASAASSSRL
ncbi:MAG: hypothetical protein WCX29_03360, partial [Candidatus Peribacteraceae bacterium]